MVQPTTLVNGLRPEKVNTTLERMLFLKHPSTEADIVDLRSHLVRYNDLTDFSGLEQIQQRSQDTKRVLQEVFKRILLYEMGMALAERYEALAREGRIGEDLALDMRSALGQSQCSIFNGEDYTSAHALAAQKAKALPANVSVFGRAGVSYIQSFASLLQYCGPRSQPEFIAVTFGGRELRFAVPGWGVMFKSLEEDPVLSGVSKRGVISPAAGYLYLRALTVEHADQFIDSFVKQKSVQIEPSEVSFPGRPIDEHLRYCARMD